MSLMCFWRFQRDMDDAASAIPDDFADDLCKRYQDMERAHAVHLDMCELILSSTDSPRREWVQLPAPPDPGKP